MNKSLAVMAVSAMALMGGVFGNSVIDVQAAESNMPKVEMPMDMQKEHKMMKKGHDKVMKEQKMMDKDHKKIKDDHKKMMDDHEMIMDDHKEMKSQIKDLQNK